MRSWRCFIHSPFWSCLSGLRALDIFRRGRGSLTLVSSACALFLRSREVSRSADGRSPVRLSRRVSKHRRSRKFRLRYGLPAARMWRRATILCLILLRVASRGNVSAPRIFAAGGEGIKEAGARKFCPCLGRFGAILEQDLGASHGRY